jgi:hypothetical protein
MALIHYLYIGHFIPEEGYVRFQGNRPVVTRPIDMTAVSALLQSYHQEGAASDEVPNVWAMSIWPDYIVCDQFGSAAEALKFAADYAEQTGATVLNLGSFSLMTSAQLRESATVRIVSAPTVEVAATVLPGARGAR